MIAAWTTHHSCAKSLRKPLPSLDMAGNNPAWFIQDSTECQGYLSSPGPTSSDLLPEPDTSKAKPSNKAEKHRRLKPRIELAPDQPPTTQGKPRARVYVACLQCRTRKIRCDGTKPVCHNCNRRSIAECEYDLLPKRRGPDRTPGARQRIPRNHLEAPRPPRRRRRKDPEDKLEGPEGRSENLATSPLHQPSTPNREPGVPHLTAITANASKCRCHDALYCPMSIVSHPPVNDLVTHQDPCFNLYSDSGSCYLAVVGEKGNARQNDVPVIEYGPSLSFTRKIWWDSLLCLYLSPSATPLRRITPDQREMAARSIVSDLKFAFCASNYWFSFFHIPTFFGTFCDPVRRERMQPCLVLALLAVATFLHSSELEMSDHGRMRALRFRDEAQAALEASISSNWIDEAVAQAAWVLAMFEVCAHPMHSAARVMSALGLLDSLIRSLSLTLLDVDDTDTPLFPPRSVPSISPKVTSWLCNDSDSAGSNFRSMPNRSTSFISATPNIGCSCKALTLAANWPLTDEHAPLWGHTPAWHATWNAGEIKKESCRRLCWSSLTLAAGYVSYMSANQEKPPDLFIANPANYALLLSGEYTTRLPVSLPIHASKDTIWALYDRSYLLWHACIRMRNDTTALDTEKAQFAVKAWLEADMLETALNRHTCDLERAFMFHAREYIFNIRMCISYEYRRWIPLATANVSGLFHRSKAEEWLTHQACVARRLMDGLHTVTGNSGNVLARRPFFVFWFMGQINRAMYLWEYDYTLIAALDVCKAFVTAVDYLSSLWPCPDQRREYAKLRLKVDNACRIACVSPLLPV